MAYAEISTAILKYYMHFIMITTLANDFTDAIERHELVIGARVCKQCISCLKQLATIADQYFIFRQLSGYFKKIKTKKNENEQNFSSDWLQHEKYNSNVRVLSNTCSIKTTKCLA